MLICFPAVLNPDFPPRGSKGQERINYYLYHDCSEGGYP